MIKSMTGYGKGEASFAGGRVNVEIRSVNHRYGEIYVKLPRNLIVFENDLRRFVSDRLKRGKIEVFVQYEPSAEAAPLSVNFNLAKAYHEALTSLKSRLGLAGEVSVQLIAAQKDVLTAEETHSPEEALRDALLAAVKGGVEALEAMRSMEGGALLDDLRKRMETVAALADKVARRAPHVVSEYSAKLKERLAQITADNAVSEERLAQEVAIMADRCDITEELVRLRSHLDQFEAALSLGDPVGRKLDFLLQELSREVNTMGSKANDAEIAIYVVELKSEIEKIREQVQNIE
ncbi:MAG TPA: YicC/YloC family endoribonuclease [Geobacteraceae bacterium]|nr:YicC/YloC family endoribonuclease [Geobacteraceae bacterium]